MILSLVSCIPKAEEIPEINFCIKFFGQEYQNKLRQPLDIYIDLEEFLWAIAYNEAYFLEVKIQDETRLKREAWYLRQISRSPYKNNPLAFCSLGDLQVLYGTAWIQGFDLPPEELIQPRYCVPEACKFIVASSKTYRYFNNIVATYSQGHPYKNKGEYNNPKTYVCKVRKLYLKRVREKNKKRRSQ